MTLNEDLISNENAVTLTDMNPNFEYSTSLNTENMLVVYGHPKEEKKHFYTFKIFDKNLRALYEKKIDLTKYKFIDQVDYALNENNDLSVVFKVSANGLKFTDAKINIDFLVYHFNAQNNDSQSSTIQWRNQFLSHQDVKSNLDTNGIYSIYGLYHKTKINDESEGIFLATFDTKKMTQIRNSLLPFDITIIAKFLDIKDAQKGKLPTNLNVIKKFASPNGDETFVLEVGYTNIVSDPLSSSRQSYFEEYRNTIVVIRSTSGGEILWSYVIPKESYSRGSSQEYTSRYINTYSFSYKENTYLLFNSNRDYALKAEKNKDRYVMGDKKDVVVVLIGINGKGERTLSKLFNQPEEESELCEYSDIQKIKANALLLTFKEKNMINKMKNSSRAIVEIID